MVAHPHDADVRTLLGLPPSAANIGALSGAFESTPRATLSAHASVPTWSEVPVAGRLRRRYSREMRPLRYSINVTLDGCCDHRAGIVDEDLHRHAAESIAQADALLFGRVTYEMMETAWRPAARTGARPDPDGDPHRGAELVR